MSISLMTLAWKAGLESSPKFVLLSLCDNANDQGECVTSLSMIAKRCGMSTLGACRPIQTLVDMGLLTVFERAGRTIYRLDERRLAAISIPSSVTEDSE